MTSGVKPLPCSWKNVAMVSPNAASGIAHKNVYRPNRGEVFAANQGATLGNQVQLIGQQLLQVRDENLDLAFIHTGPFLLSDSPTVRGAIEIVQPIVSINGLGAGYFLLSV